MTNWEQLAAPIPADRIEWRRDGAITKNYAGKFSARFVPFIEFGTVRDRLDAVVPGRWMSTLELLPERPLDERGEKNDMPVAFKCTITILGDLQGNEFSVSRENVGIGRDYKQAATDAFKRAGVLCGIGRELYEMEFIYVEMDGDHRGAKPVEPPEVVYARRMGETPAARALNNRDFPGREDRERGNGSGASASQARSVEMGGSNPTTTSATTTSSSARDKPICPKCGSSALWDNRATKKNPRQPDYRCKDRNCDGVIWPPRETRPGTMAHAMAELEAERSQAGTISGQPSFEDFPDLEPPEDQEDFMSGYR